MKWFKHISDSLDDPFIFNLIEKHDANGYLVFFGILEIYAREFKTEPGWKLQVTLPYLRRKLNRTRNKLITNVLRTLGELSENFGRTSEELCTNVDKTFPKSPKWDVEITGDDVSIFIPKFKELMDESTLKKLRETEKSFRKDSGLIPKSAPTEAEADKEEDKDKEKDIEKSPSTGKSKADYSEEFMNWFAEYPVKVAKQKAFEVWQKIKPDAQNLRLRLSIQKKQREQGKAQSIFIPEWPNPTTYLNQARWEDDFATQLGGQVGKPLFGLSPEAEAQIRERDEYEAKLKLEREEKEDA